MISVLIITTPQLANIIRIWMHEKNICISCHNITQEQHQKNTIPVSAFLYRYSFAETKRGADTQTNPSRAHRVYMPHHPKPVSMVTRAEEPATAFTATLKYIFPLEFRRRRVTTPIIQWSSLRHIVCWRAALTLCLRPLLNLAQTCCKPMEAFLSVEEMLLRALMRFLAPHMNFLSHWTAHTSFYEYEFNRPNWRLRLQYPAHFWETPKQKSTLSWISNASLELGNSEDWGPVSARTCQIVVFVHV